MGPPAIAIFSVSPRLPPRAVLNEARERWLSDDFTPALAPMICYVSTPRTALFTHRCRNNSKHRHARNNHRLANSIKSHRILLYTQHRTIAQMTKQHADCERHAKPFQLVRSVTNARPCKDAIPYNSHLSSPLPRVILCDKLRF